MRATVLLALLVALVPGPAGLAGATVGDGAADDPSPLLSGASGAAAEGGGGAAPPTDPPASPALPGLRSSEVLGIREPAVTDRERATHWGWPLTGVPGWISKRSNVAVIGPFTFSSCSAPATSRSWR